MTQNYESKYWGLVYDQMMERDLGEWLATTRRYYSEQLQGLDGPVLECGCGSGLILLPLLEQGIDMYGFDISQAMLDALVARNPGAASRVSRQTFDSFSYARSFDAIIIPTNSFAMLTTREQQLATLKNIASHLGDGGRLLMDIRLADREWLEETKDGVEGQWHEWTHPETGRVIRQRIVAAPHDFERQLFRDRCYFEYGNDREDFPIESRWIFKEEFEELLKLSGFGSWQLETGEWGSYWNAVLS